jgi:hypothetical protein
MDILVRDISKEDADALDAKAKAAGADNRGEWLAQQLHNLAGVPEVYGFRIIGQVGKGAIRRYSSHINGTSTTFANFNQDEADVMQHAENFIRRNQPGDKERALSLLVSQFGEDNVFEVPV